MSTEVICYRCDVCGAVHGTEEEADECHGGVPKPLPLSLVKLEALEVAVQEYLEEVEMYTAGGVKDGEQVIFEAVIEAYYGKDIWKWIKAQKGTEV